MIDLKDLGYEIVEVPIRQVRVINHGKRWFVEYRLKNSRFWFDKWWWYDDSIHSDFSDASVRAYVLNATGKFERLKKVNTVVMTVKE